jgi:hypothetical protein
MVQAPPRLPHELWPIIISHIHNPKDLLHCALVSHSHSKMALKKLKKSVTFHSLSQSQNFLASTCHPSTNIDTYLSVTPPGPPKQQFLSCCVLDFGFGMNHENHYGREWSHHFIDGKLIMISTVCPQLEALILERCHYMDTLLAFTLSSLPHLKYLNVSYSTIKKTGFSAIREVKSLKILDVSGTFRLKRNDPSILMNVCESLPCLQQVVIRDCPDIPLSDFKAKLPHVQFIL